MNKHECKKYIKRAYDRLRIQSKSMTPENIAIEMERVINSESRIYVAYAKLAMYNLNHSANEINAKQLMAQVDVIPKIYDQSDILIKAENI